MTDIAKKKAIWESTTLLNGAEDSTIMCMAEASLYQSFAAGEVVMAAGGEQRALGVVASGYAEVYKTAGESRVLISVIGCGALLGAAGLFLKDAKAVTEVIAKKPVELLFIGEDRLRSIMAADFNLTERYLSYLTERIHFLTSRIESIGAKNVEDKLLTYLAGNAENGKLTLPFGYSALADALCVSRASLYRVMDVLEKNGKIARKGRNIIIKGE